MFYEERYTGFCNNSYYDFRDTVCVYVPYKESKVISEPKRSIGIPKVAPDRYRSEFSRNSAPIKELRYKQVMKVSKIKRGSGMSEDVGSSRRELTLEERLTLYCNLHPTWVVADYDHGFFDMHGIPRYGVTWGTVEEGNVLPAFFMPSMLNKEPKLKTQYSPGVDIEFKL